ncbi:MAG TPA: hypothetical protein VGG74_03435 [Kofleriaceae bacterium]|jgi:hypothetical protein
MRFDSFSPVMMPIAAVKCAADQHEAIVVEDRDLPIRVEPQKFGRALASVFQIDDGELEGHAEMARRQHDPARIRRQRVASRSEYRLAVRDLAGRFRTSRR